MSILSDELTNDPLAIGYAGMTDAQAKDSLNGLTRTRTRETVSGSEIFNAIDDTEYAALTDAQKTVIREICSIDLIDTSNGIAKSEIGSIFAGAAGTATRPALQALKTESISRAQELGISQVNEGDITHARA